MDINKYWGVIDDARFTTGNDQEAMLRCVETTLAQLPAKEVAEWFSIHQEYLHLADCENTEKAISLCNLSFSDDSFLYFRGWLLSLGKDAFYSIMNNPEALSAYISASIDARFEGFVYPGSEVYVNKAFLEEYGLEGMKQWKESWYAQNPDKSEFALNMALADKYNIWDVSAKHPLSAAAKEEIRSDLFSHFSDKRRSSLSGQIQSTEACSMKAVDIDWDVDSEAERDSLPSEIEIPEGMEGEEDISDYLSDVTGFCHKGFKLVDCSKEAARDMGGEPTKPSLSDQIQSASTRAADSHASPDTPVKTPNPER